MQPQTVRPGHCLQQRVWGAMTAAGDSVSLLTVQMQQTRPLHTGRRAIQGSCRIVQTRHPTSKTNCATPSLQSSSTDNAPSSRLNKLTLPEQGHHNTALSLTHHRGIAALPPSYLTSSTPPLAPQKRGFVRLHSIIPQGESDMETAAKARSRGRARP